MKSLDGWLVFAGLFAAGAAHAGGPRTVPPKADSIPQRLEKSGHLRTDDYFWLRDRDNPETLKYLRAENAYAEAALANVNNFSSSLFREIKSRIKKDDSTPPFRDGHFYYTVHFRDLRTGKSLPDRLENVTPNLAWAEDGRTLFYAKQHPETLRRERIFRHELGSGPDAEVYHEPNESFTAFVARSRNRKYLFIGSQATLTTEYRYLDASSPAGERK